MVKKSLILFLVYLSLIVVSFKTANSKEDRTTEGDFEPIVVLELFTSQGCSSCPPADILLDKVKNQYPEKVFALSYHVDYWNYIGWEDPFSNANYTKKQSFYNRKFRNNSNYTPQMVINGQEHFVGSNATKLNSKIGKYSTGRAANPIDIVKAGLRNAQIAFDYAVVGYINDKTLRAVLVLDEKTTTVKRGENRNRTLKNSNIVVQEKYIDLKGNSGSGTIQIPSWIDQNDKLQLMVLVENDNMDILGAAKMDL